MTDTWVNPAGEKSAGNPAPGRRGYPTAPGRRSYAAIRRFGIRLKPLAVVRKDQKTGNRKWRGAGNLAHPLRSPIFPLPSSILFGSGVSRARSVRVHLLADKKTKKPAGQWVDRPVLNESVFNQIPLMDYEVCFLRRMRRVLTPKGSSNNAPATTVLGSGTTANSGWPGV